MSSRPVVSCIKLFFCLSPFNSELGLCWEQRTNLEKRVAQSFVKSVQVDGGADVGRERGHIDIDQVPADVVAHAIGINDSCETVREEGNAER